MTVSWAKAIGASFPGVALLYDVPSLDKVKQRLHAGGYQNIVIDGQPLQLRALVEADAPAGVSLATAAQQIKEAFYGAAFTLDEGSILFEQVGPGSSGNIPAPKKDLTGGGDDDEEDFIDKYGVWIGAGLVGLIIWKMIDD